MQFLLFHHTLFHHNMHLKWNPLKWNWLLLRILSGGQKIFYIKNMKNYLSGLSHDGRKSFSANESFITFSKTNTCFRNSNLSAFYKIDVLKTSAKFLGKQICWRHFLINLQAFQPELSN